MRDIDYRIDVLRDNVKVTELASVSAPTIRAEATSEIKTSFSGEFADNKVINWLTDELKPVVIIDGVETSLGVYAPTTYSLSADSTQKTISVEAYDRCWLLQVKRADHILHFNSGTNYIDVITSLLVECGISIVNATPTSLTLANDREDWDVGTTYLSIINELLNEISYNSIWFNKDGIAIIEPKQQVMTGDIVRQYSFSNIKTLCISLSATMDFFNAPNAFLCVCSNADHDLWTYKAVNDNPASPLSTVRRGREIVKYVKVSNIASEEELANYATNLVNDNMMIYQTISLNTGIIPEIGINEIVSIVHPDFYGLAREIGWSITLEPCGEMVHTLEATSLNLTAEIEEDTNYAIAGIAIAGIAVVGVAS